MFNQYIKNEYYEFKEEEIKKFGEHTEEEIEIINLIEQIYRNNDNK